MLAALGVSQLLSELQMGQRSVGLSCIFCFVFLYVMLQCQRGHMRLCVAVVQFACWNTRQSLSFQQTNSSSFFPSLSFVPLVPTTLRFTAGILFVQDSELDQIHNPCQQIHYSA